jgi:hypothetical protein
MFRSDGQLGHVRDRKDNRDGPAANRTGAAVLDTNRDPPLLAPILAEPHQSRSQRATGVGESRWLADLPKDAPLSDTRFTDVGGG